MDKVSPENASTRDPNRNYVRYFGKILQLGEAHLSDDEKPIESPTFDESQWIEVIKFAQQKNWYFKIEIIGGAVIGTIIEIPVQEIWEFLKARLSKNDQQTDLMEKLKDLPLEEILKKIREHLDNFPL